MSTSQTISLHAETEATIRGLTRLQKRQIPFAIARGLTLTAKDAQQQAQRRTVQYFNIRSPWTPRQIAIRPAKKSAGALMHADVFTRSSVHPWLTRHEYSGIKTPRRRTIAVPASGLRNKAFRTRSGKVRSRWTPASLLDSGAFILDDGRTPVIAKAKRGGGLEIYWLLVEQARISQGWNVIDAIEDGVRLNYEWHLRKSLDEAIRTAH